MLKTRNELLEMKLQEKIKDTDRKVQGLEGQLEVLNVEMRKGLNNQLEEMPLSSSAVHVPTPPIEKFDGMNWDAFSTQFECASSCCGWTESEKLFNLLQHLKGEAHNFVFVKCADGDRSSYENLRSALTQRFREPHESLFIFTNWKSLCSTHNEAWQHIVLMLDITLSGKRSRSQMKVRGHQWRWNILSETLRNNPTRHHHPRMIRKTSSHHTRMGRWPRVPCMTLSHRHRHHFY